MPVFRARRALLAFLAAVLIAAAPPRAAAGLTCQNFEAVLDQASREGGCESATINQDSLVTVTSPSNKTGIVFNFTSGGMPALIVDAPSGLRSWTFKAGTDYKFTVSDPVIPAPANGTAPNGTCAGTVTIKPCKPVCRDLSLNVTATTTDDACGVPILTSLFDPSGFLAATSVGSTATNATLTVPNSRPERQGPAPQAYSVGVWRAAAEVVYPNGKTEKSDECTITITDVTVMAPPVPGNQTCFYANTSGGQINVPLTAFAARPPGPRCRNQRLNPMSCDPEMRSRNRRLCLPNVRAPSSNAQPVTVSAVNLVRKNTRSTQPLTVTVQTYDLNGPIGGEKELQITVYKSRRAVPAGQRDSCTPVWRRW
ncbi:MAG: hypothetical protein J3K34DRAFT_416864 [Monoraphidium minutum]|nr:MAG: hypothetical protein J3K34DRAFT_416864 [Monoraphidium minutum]